MKTLRPICEIEAEMKHPETLVVKSNTRQCALCGEEDHKFRFTECNKCHVIICKRCKTKLKDRVEITPCGLCQQKISQGTFSGPCMRCRKRMEACPSPSCGRLISLGEAAGDLEKIPAVKKPDLKTSIERGGPDA